MPFITQQKRDLVEAYGLDERYFFPEVGDRCYFFYKEMVRQWKENPRWTTAHEIYKELLQKEHPGWDNCAAINLAWQVFFQLYVMPYELKKRKENGDI